MAPARVLDPRDPGVRRAWAALLGAAPDRSPFGALAYAEAAAGAFGLRPVAVGVEAGGGLAGGVVAYEKRRGPYRLAVEPPLTPVTPFVLAEAPREADVHARRSVLDRLVAALDARFDALAFRLQPSLTDVRPFTWAGYRAAPLYSYARRLASADGLLADAGKGVRNRVRRSADAYTLAEEPGRLDVLDALEAEVYARQDVARPVDPAQERAFVRALTEAGLGRLFVLRERGGGEAVGARLVVTDGAAAFFVTAAARRGDAMTVMNHLVAVRLFEEGVETLDLVGANRPGTAEFKRGFGFPLVTQYRVVRVRRPLLRAVALVRPVV